jgi:hypothetical protein
LILLTCIVLSFLLPIISWIITVPVILLTLVAWFVSILFSSLSQQPYRCTQCGQIAGELTAEQEGTIARHRDMEKARLAPLLAERARDRAAKLRRAWVQSIASAKAALPGFWTPIVAAIERTNRTLVTMSGGEENMILYRFFQGLTVIVFAGVLTAGLWAIGSWIAGGFPHPTVIPGARTSPSPPASGGGQDTRVAESEQLRTKAEAEADRIRTQAEEEASKKRAMPFQAADVFKPIDLTKMKLDNGQAFGVQDDVAVDGRLVRRLTLGITKYSVEMVVLMKNNTSSSLRPSIKFEFYNRYGMILGDTEVSWKLDTLSPGAAYSENTKGYLHEIAPYFRYSSVPLPADLDNPAYVVVVDSSP